MTGHLYAVGVGPGDPDLVTVRAARLIGQTPVLAYFSGPRGTSIARGIADPYVGEPIEELLRYPVTTGTTDHQGGYYGAIEEFYDAAADRLAAHLSAGRDVVVLAEGDPLFYGSYMYLHDRLAPRFPATIVPGVTSMQGATAALAQGLARHEDVLTVLPGTLPVPDLAWRLAQTDAAVVLKLGRTFPGVREALRQAGRLEDAWFVERASQDGERVQPVADVDESTVPYFSMIVVVGRDNRADSAGRSGAVRRSESAKRVDAGNHNGSHPSSGAGTVSVIGLGPGPAYWLTPEAAARLAEVGHVYGYAPYVDRVPQRPGLQRHPSGNTVEVDRARAALAMAARGEAVAVVSGGDAGIFGMASAVFEAATDPAYAHVRVEVLPGVSAAQAVAARAGAPLGADFAVLSLSDRLKPWPVLAERLRAAARADLVLALYNPRSRSRPTQLADAREVLLEVRSPDTVVVVGRDIGRAEESLTVTTLGDFDPATVDMKCLVLIGAASTRVTPAGQVWTPRFVEVVAPH
ncbi:precorrin-2 C(20)-methyltransferase [Granulicoccus phenolivorans]|uniref:precorrin-2 C(20)-methyltransferase n=1 Tax=Granulicoccus phenolivorans TaxID=266854 RepID=UPI00041B7EFF|nr:precorrin-2 C(20)-methyltransferase [Granulicoccus phenolivorans]